jgi:hypothetical protein
MQVLRKALFVTPFAPLPQVEGHRKRMSATFAALKSLGYRMDMLMLALEHDWVERFDTEIFNAMRDMAATFHFVRGRNPQPLASGIYGVDDWWLPQFEDYAGWLLRNVSYDLVLTNYIFTSRVLQLARPNTVRVLETHDLFAGRREMLEERGMRVEFFYTDAANEAEGLRRADLVLSIKEQEETAFRAYGIQEVLTLPYVEQTAFAAAPLPRRCAAGGRPVFGYFASRNQINVRNFLEFMDAVDRLRVPGLPPLDIRAFGSICDVLPEDPQRRYLRGGRVARPADFYSAVDCVIVPQHFSTGLKIKLGEALAHGRPIIAHEHAFEGFGPALDDALVCSSFEDMVRRMYRFADDPGMATALAEAVQRTQIRQVEQLHESVRAIGTFTRRARANLMLLADGVALRRDKLYRFVVEAVSTAFVGSWRVVLGLPQDELAALSDDDLVGAVTAAVGYERVEELHRAEASGFDWAGALVMDPRVLSPSALAGFRGCPVFVAEDITRYVATMAGHPLAPLWTEANASMARATWRLRSGRMQTTPALAAIGGRDPRSIPVSFLRWSPWFFEMDRTEVGYSSVGGFWVLCRQERRADAVALARLLLDKLSLPARIYCADPVRCAATGAGTGGPPPLPAAAAYREAFQRFNAPIGVIDLAGGEPVYGLLREWLALNQVPYLELPDDDSGEDDLDVLLRSGVRSFLADAMTDRASRPPRSRPTLDWTSSGWDRVLHTLRTFVA